MKKTRYRKKKSIVIFLIVALCLVLYGATEIAKDSGKEAQKTENSVDVVSNLQIHFIDVWQGDCTLILSDGHAMLIDAGNDSKGTAVQLYLMKQGIFKLDYVIGTHPDSDHIGGLDVILTKFACDTIMLPDCSSDTDAYRDVMKTMEYRGYRNTQPTVGTSYTLGDCTFTILSPDQKYEDTNNNSICIRLTHGENSFLFTGDAEEPAEEEMRCGELDVSADVLKVAHHGSSSSTSAAFLKAVHPTYAVISCGKDNFYGHPHTEVLSRLQSAGVNVYRTDELGTVIAESDGKNITFGTQEAAYILNTNTGTFHYADCEGAADMKDKNKFGIDLTRDELVEQGCKPCGICRP